MTMHRLFDGRARPYILVDVKTNSEESSCAKKLFLYESLLSMLSHMNYIHIHSDKCVKNKLNSAFNMTDLKPVTYYLSMQIEQNHNECTICLT